MERFLRETLILLSAALLKTFLIKRWYLCFHRHRPRNQNATAVMQHFYFNTSVDH